MSMASVGMASGLGASSRSRVVRPPKACSIAGLTSAITGGSARSSVSMLTGAQ